ncbi:glycerophosphodiester phosphodiesterase [Marinilactibacillus sp. Marseille-P9653]|uniref:glycerophosphodiester phosphodiesterase n=1 Tax=Marinilactibacillus sp. Marseille-P9653 TaxID=2866583 RepID=UPI001CE3E804|nr:glycerophosphodiester phosphodiesterase [Marinilactibacillus sp. Marseille-P9653]
MSSLNFAHRGFSSQFPENTMLAFEKAVEAGADGIELDVQLTRDKEVVIFHDDTLERLTNGTGTLRNFTLAELQQLSIGSQKCEEVLGQQIPTLREYLNWVSDTELLTNIELKTASGDPTGLEQKVLELIDLFNVKEKIIISSFHVENMSRVKQLDSEIQTGLLVIDCDEKTVQKALELEMDYLHPLASKLDKTVIEHINKLNLKINTWTINEVSDLQKANAANLYGIITDYPDRLKEIQEQSTELTH